MPKLSIAAWSVGLLCLLGVGCSKKEGDATPATTAAPSAATTDGAAPGAGRDPGVEAFLADPKALLTA